ncbi:hypothetical protein [Pseudoroseomonas cervicalis]|uniref:hypothetical protein n=1 Tax=Teichococcus cervicalis TaxID=204525 RepID=UPI0022F18FDA|nr:hypothetical protein [Pseudoroseomonas cervicalis]WBV45562.1 hypothetical protein PFY06_21355 [Pseudoroseomonas cervicalis]
MSEAEGGFLRRDTPQGVEFIIRPAPPARGFLAAALLLALLFGLPALAVLADPRRHDVVSLGAALAGLAVAGLAAAAWRGARHGRQPRLLRADATGLTLPEAHLPWSALAGIRLEQPGPGRHAQAATGVHALAARIATQQRAAETRLWAELATPGPALLLAGGLGPGAAAALREALLALRPPPQ